MADLITSDRRVGPAIGLTWLPGGTGSRIRPPSSVGEGTLERYTGAKFQI